MTKVQDIIQRAWFLQVEWGQGCAARYFKCFHVLLKSRTVFLVMTFCVRNCMRAFLSWNKRA